MSGPTIGNLILMTLICVVVFIVFGPQRAASQPSASRRSTNHFVGKTAGPSNFSSPAPGKPPGIWKANFRTPAAPYRGFSGQSLCRTGEAYGLSRIRPHKWHGAKADSSLAKVMTTQKNPPASFFTAPGAGPGTTTTRRWWPKSRRSSSPNFNRRCA